MTQSLPREHISCSSLGNERQIEGQRRRSVLSRARKIAYLGFHPSQRNHCSRSPVLTARALLRRNSALNEGPGFLKTSEYASVPAARLSDRAVISGEPLESAESSRAMAAGSFCKNATW